MRVRVRVRVLGESSKLASLLCGTMSTTQPPEKRATRSEGYRSLFMDVFPQLVGELTDDGVKNTEISVGIQHLKEVRQH